MLPVARREARERALSLLYEAESKGVAPAAVLAELPGRARPLRRRPGPRGRGAAGAIDELIAGHAIGWTLERMPVVDRALLRMATYELLARPDVPTGVVISEAVELATQYSTEESGPVRERGAGHDRRQCDWAAARPAHPVEWCAPDPEMARPPERVRPRPVWP